MPYIYLIIAISTEVIGSAFLKSSEGFSKFIPSFRIKLNKFSSKKDIIDITSSQKVHKWLNNRAPLFTREMVDVDFRI